MLASCVISVILIQGSAAKDATCSQPEHTGDEPSLLQARYEFDSEAMLRPAVEPRSCTFEDFGEYGIFVPHCLPPPPPKRLASCWVPRQGIDLEDLPDCFNTYDGETLKETYTKAVDDTTEWPEFCTMEDFKAVFTISDDDGANCMRKARKKLVPFCECAAWKSTVSNEDVPSCWNDVQRELLMDTFHSCQDASLPACTPQEYMTVGDDPNLCLTHPDGDEDRFCDCWAPTGSVQVPPICWNTFLHEPLYVSFDKCKKIRPEAPTESPTAAPTAAPTALPTAEKKTCCTEPTAKCLSCLMTNMTAHEFCAKYPGLYDCPKATTPSPTKSPTKAPTSSPTQACCTEMTATCLSCWGHMTVEDFCAQNVGLYDCPPAPTPIPTSAPSKAPTLLPTQAQTSASVLQNTARNCGLQDFGAFGTMSKGCWDLVNSSRAQLCDCWAPYPPTATAAAGPLCMYGGEIASTRFDGCQAYWWPSKEPTGPSITTTTSTPTPDCGYEDFANVGDITRDCLESAVDGESTDLCDCWAPDPYAQALPTCFNQLLNEPFDISYAHCVNTKFREGCGDTKVLRDCDWLDFMISGDVTEQCWLTVLNGTTDMCDCWKPTVTPQGLPSCWNTLRAEHLDRSFAYCKAATRTNMRPIFYREGVSIHEETKTPRSWDLGNKPFSVFMELRFPQNPWPTTRQWLFGMGQPGRGAHRWLWSPNHGIQFGVWGDGSMQIWNFDGQTAESSSVEIASAKSLTAVYNGSHYALWMDGVKRAEKGGFVFAIEASDVWIGRFFGADRFKGDIKAVAIYDFALPDDVIQDGLTLPKASLMQGASTRLRQPAANELLRACTLEDFATVATIDDSCYYSQSGGADVCDCWLTSPDNKDIPNCWNELKGEALAMTYESCLQLPQQASASTQMLEQAPTEPPTLAPTVKLVRGYDHDGLKCGGPESDSNVFELQGDEATEEACFLRCFTEENCVGMSGIWGTWCTGCSQALEAPHPGAVAWVTPDADSQVRMVHYHNYDGKKCGDSPADSGRVFKLVEQNSDEDNCVTKCAMDPACVSVSGRWGHWCVGCRRLVSTDAPGTITWVKAEAPASNPSLLDSAAPCPTNTSLQPTMAPASTPTLDPTSAPASTPTLDPTSAPASTPTLDPTSANASTPTLAPTLYDELPPCSPNPTLAPTLTQPAAPASTPTLDPTTAPASTPTLDPTRAPASTPTLDPTANASTPTVQPTGTPTLYDELPPCTPSPTVSPTDASGAPASNPTLNPTLAPASNPTLNPTLANGVNPTLQPTGTPTLYDELPPCTPSPTVSPTDASTLANASTPTLNPLAPASAPTLNPTNAPASAPTLDPTNAMATFPTGSSTLAPASAPTLNPTLAPASTPTSDPTGLPPCRPVSPTLDPTAPASTPTLDPTAPASTPTLDPTEAPASTPTLDPTAPASTPTGLPPCRPVTPSLDPTSAPTTNPTSAPASVPTLDPVLPPCKPVTPTLDPTGAPASAPTLYPTEAPASAPTLNPTTAPASAPTLNPTTAPASTPTVNPTLDPTGAPPCPMFPTVAPTEVTIPSQSPRTPAPTPYCTSAMLATIPRFYPCVADIKDGALREQVVRAVKQQHGKFLESSMQEMCGCLLKAPRSSMPACMSPFSDKTMREEWGRCSRLSGTTTTTVLNPYHFCGGHDLARAAFGMTEKCRWVLSNSVLSNTTSGPKRPAADVCGCLKEMSSDAVPFCLTPFSATGDMLFEERRRCLTRAK